MAADGPKAGFERGVAENWVPAHVQDAVADAKEQEAEEAALALDNPIVHYKDQYVFNMWKFYNHNYAPEGRRKKLVALVGYGMWVLAFLWVLTYLPPPAEMRRHQEAVSDLLLGEEFDQDTTHIFKSFYDVMTAEEMWQWAAGPLAAALLVDGEPDGNMGALLGTNWLLGPVRIRQERSHDEAKTCNEKLGETFGAVVGERLVTRGVKCTAGWAEANANGDGDGDGGDDGGGGDFLDLTKPVDVLGGLSFEQAFPDWYSVYATPRKDSPRGSVIDAPYCCSLGGCFTDKTHQKKIIDEKIASAAWGLFADASVPEFACSVNLTSKRLARNPPRAYRSTIKGDSTESAYWLSGTREFGTGGFHIDLPGNSSTFVNQLKALEELNFIDHFTRTVTFQFMLINANAFDSPDDDGYLSFLLRKEDPVVVVCVDVNFVFSPSGHLKSFERITPMQMTPLGFLGISGGDNNEASVQWNDIAAFVLSHIVPLWIMFNELRLIVKYGFFKWIMTGWSWFEIVYIFVVWKLCKAVGTFLAEEKLFLDQYYNEDKMQYSSNAEDFFNDSLALRTDYRVMFKSLGLVCLVAVFKVFKYARVFEATTLLWSTLTLARTQLLTFCVVMLWLICAFGVCGTLYWGFDSVDFHNIPTSFFSLLRMAAGEGEVDYRELKKGDAGMTPWLFFAFTMIVTILSTNLMIGIVTDFYEEARDNLSKQYRETVWIQHVFDSDDAHEYDDVYGGQGLWNEPSSAVGLGGRVNAIVEALWGIWHVRTVPANRGPRSWNKEKGAVKFENVVYPFVLHRSDEVHLRYQFDAHEHYAGKNLQKHAERAQKEVDEEVEKSRQARAKTFADHDNVEDLPKTTTPPLQLWIAASTLAQYRGIDYLEELREGDPIKLITPCEGGLPGRIKLEFSGRKNYRRASLADIQAVNHEIQQLELNLDTGNTDQVKKLQSLHQERMLLEGVDKIMVFKVSNVETWQKFRPLAPTVGKQLKEAAEVDNKGNRLIALSAVVEVLVDAVMDTVNFRAQEGSKSEDLSESIKQKIKEMADKEQEIKDEHQAVKYASSGFCTCGGMKHHDPDEASYPIYQLHKNEKCPLGLLITDEAAAEPTFTPAMKRLVKKAQRTIYNDHTPLIEIPEETQFDLRIPKIVRPKLIWRRLFPGCCSRVCRILYKALPLPGREFHFHTSIFQDVDEFLAATCATSVQLPSAVRRSPKLLMRELMSKEKSLSLEDFLFQLEHYTFRAKPKKISEKMRKRLYQALKKCTCLHRCCIGLRNEMRESYTLFEAELALRYCVAQYNEFIDLRLGSLPGQAPNEGGVWLEKPTYSELERVFRKHLNGEDEDEDEESEPQRHHFEICEQISKLEELIEKLQVQSLEQPLYTKTEAGLAQHVVSRRTRPSTTPERAMRKKDEAAPLTSAEAAVEETTAQAKVDAVASANLTVQNSTQQRDSLLAELAELKQDSPTNSKEISEGAPSAVAAQPKPGPELGP